MKTVEELREGMKVLVDACDEARKRRDELERENAELKRIIAESKEQKPICKVRQISGMHEFSSHISKTTPFQDGQVGIGDSLYASPIIYDGMELLGYAHQCDDYDGSVISTDKDEYGDKTVAIYKIKETK